MATVATLASPGVEVREYDESLRIETSTGTTVFIPGFASQGPVEEINPIGSMDDFENLYGKPTNAAERYFYYTVKAVLDRTNDGTTVLTSRLAYGAGDGDNVSNAFTILAYPAIPIVKNSKNEKGVDYYTLDDTLLKQLVQLKKSDEGTIDASLVTADVYLTNAAKALGTLKLTKIEIPAGKFLPSAGQSLPDYEGEITLSWTLKDVAQTTKGAVSTETVNGNLVVHAVFALKDKSNHNLGIVKIDATYASTAVAGAAYNTLTFQATAVEGLEATQVSAFEVSKYYSAEGVNEKEGIEKYDDVTYVVGAPASFQISLSEYYQLISGELFDWSNEPYKFEDITQAQVTDEDKFGMFKALKHSAFIVANPSRTIVNDSFEGFYFGITDNLFNTDEIGHTFNAIDSVKVTTLNSTQETNGKGLLEDAYQTMGRGRLDFYLDSNNKGSLSQVLQGETNDFDTSSVEYDDTINFALFKLKKSTVANEIMKLTYSLAEQHNASLGKTRQYSISTATTPQNYFVENILENSANITAIVNPFIANNILVDINNNLLGKIRIYSNKLLSNYKRMEAKYVSGYTTTVADINPDKTTQAPIRAAASSIQSWTDLVRQVGVSLEVLDGLAANKTFVESNSIYPFGAYTAVKTANKFIGNVPYKLERTLTLISNDETYPDIDIICDAGLSTIYAYSNTTNIIGSGASMIVDAADDDLALESMGANPRGFDENLILAGIEDMRTGRTSYSEYAQYVIEDYMSVQQQFMSIANSETNGGRGNTFFIGDMLRGIFIKGKNTKVTSLFGSPLTNSSYDDSTSVNHNWSTSIMYPCKHLTETLTSSFCSLYAQWFKLVDNVTGEKVWVPASGYVAAKMCQADSNNGPWDAAAGYNRGIVDNVIDIALNPTLSQRSDLYKLCINTIPSMPNIGPVIWGIRTMSKKASAFDQNTCRRTFLYLEKRVKQVLRYFVFERNDSYTQLRIYNELDPFLASLQAQGAIYNYTLVCDNTNNTDEVVNAGCLVVSISAAPERTAENIILNVTATKYNSTITTSTIGQNA